MVVLTLFATESIKTLAPVVVIAPERVMSKSSGFSTIVSSVIGTLTTSGVMMAPSDGTV